ncbi:pseudouridine synthase [Burkholderiaceae bacterium DAT-1]|nr:pseudouridine synthase [Burkholderiaceae bacterium DAT-1]
MLEKETLPVIYHDDWLIAVHKPSGLLVHRSEIDRHETRFALQIVRDQIGRRVNALHRLDKGTSGILLFAFDADITRVMSQAFEQGNMHKRYQAIVRGWPPESGEIDHALSRPKDEYLAARNPDACAPQPALTRYTRLATATLDVMIDRYPQSRYALLELEPVTGRRHQLRRHMKHIAHPIIGDATYGKGIHNRYFQTAFGVNRLLLACTEMGFNHPVSGERIELKVSPAEDFMAVVAGLGMDEV